MTTFHFRLATVLKLRQADRRERQIELGEAYRAEQVLRERMDSLAEELSAHQRRAKSAAANDVINVNELLDMNRYELVLRTQSATLSQQSDQLREEIDRRREAVVAADREVQVLEKLRDRRLAAHEQAEAYRELKELDEVAQQQTQRKRR